MPGWMIAWPTGKEIGVAGKLLQEGGWRQHLAAGSGQLDGKWHAAEAATDFEYGRGIARVDREIAAYGTGPGREERASRGACDLGWVRSLTGEFQWRHRKLVLPADMQGRAAGHQHGGGSGRVEE